MRLPYSWLREVVQRGAPGWDVALLADEDGLRRMGEAARGDVESRFGLDGYVRRISAIACGQHAARVPA